MSQRNLKVCLTLTHGGAVSQRNLNVCLTLTHGGAVLKKYLNAEFQIFSNVN
jgi:hypothetical protein